MVRLPSRVLSRNRLFPKRKVRKLDLRLERLDRGGVVRIGSGGRLGSSAEERRSDEEEEGVEGGHGRRRRKPRLKLCWHDVLLYELDELLDGKVSPLFGVGREGFPCCREGREGRGGREREEKEGGRR